MRENAGAPPQHDRGLSHMRHMAFAPPALPRPTAPALGGGKRSRRCPLSPAGLAAPTRSHGGGAEGRRERKEHRDRPARRAGRAHTEAPAARADCGAGRPISARGAYHSLGKRGGEGAGPCQGTAGGGRGLYQGEGVLGCASAAGNASKD